MLFAEYIFYHCGNLPPSVTKGDVKLFFAESDVRLAKVFLKKERLIRRNKNGKVKREVKHW